MTNAELIGIFKTNLEESFMAAVRGVYNAGFYEGAGITPTATSPDVSRTKAKPAAVVRVRHSD
jgi:hypothetical protein